jgi:hypothetical protein
MQVLTHSRAATPLVRVCDDRFQCSLPTYKFYRLTQRNFQYQHETFCMGFLRLEKLIIF